MVLLLPIRAQMRFGQPPRQFKALFRQHPQDHLRLIVGATVANV